MFKGPWCALVDDLHTQGLEHVTKGRPIASQEAEAVAAHNLRYVRGVDARMFAMTGTLYDAHLHACSKQQVLGT
jgi:hypothetical protein